VLSTTILQDRYGDTALHKAARKGLLDIVKILIILGADRNIRNSEGLLPTELASKHNYSKCSNLLSNPELLSHVEANLFISNVKSHFETARGKFNQICFCTGNYANKRLREEEADGKDTNLSQATKRKRVCTENVSTLKRTRNTSEEPQQQQQHKRARCASSSSDESGISAQCSVQKRRCEDSEYDSIAKRARLVNN